MVWTRGSLLSGACAVSTGCSSETEMPSFTEAAACFTLAGVMRFTLPFWSSLPQRPQFESSFIQRSNCVLSTLCEDCEKAVRQSKMPVPRHARQGFMRGFYHAVPHSDGGWADHAAIRKLAASNGGAP